MKRFHYRWVDLKFLDWEKFQYRLHDLGYEGWELCGFEFGHAIFKREIFQ